VDPALAQSVRQSAERLLGRPVKVGHGKVEIPFADDHELAEIAEAFEALTSAR
jgi:hypothetical protein